MAAEPAFWYALTAAHPDLAERLRGTVLADGSRLQVLVVTAEQPREELAARLAGARYAGVVLTGLLALEAEELAAAHPEVRFVRLGPGAEGDAPLPLPANVTAVSFERSAAHERAGRLAAAYLADLPVTVPVGVVAVHGEREDAEVAAFRAGVDAGGAEGGFVVRRFDRARGRPGLRDSLDGVGRAGAAVVYLAVGELTAAALPILVEGGRRAVVANWGRRGGFEKTVLLSVDDPPLAAIVAGIEAPPGTRAAVPAQVAWGPAAGERSPTGTDP